MQLNTLKRKHPHSDRKRIGRGGKRGKTSGRGQKGQGSRAGHRLKNAERVLIQRIPKLRGTHNVAPRVRKHIQEVKLSALAKIEGDVVNKASLIKAKLIHGAAGKIKILANGMVKKAYTIEKILVSKSAKEKIEKAGGRVL